MCIISSSQTDILFIKAYSQANSQKNISLYIFTPKRRSAQSTHLNFSISPSLPYRAQRTLTNLVLLDQKNPKKIPPTTTMKPSTILFLATQITLALSLSEYAPGGPPESISVRDAPEDNDGRGTIPATSLASSGAHRLFTRACYFGTPYGCSQDKKRCWRNCGPAGEWCWLAADGGSGPWLSCSADSQCSPEVTPGSGCGKGSCDECGCSC